VKAPPPEYFANTRPEVTRHLPRVGSLLLDVGCGQGFASASLRDRGAQHVTGIEYDLAAAELARQQLDVVHQGDVGVILPALPSGQFDLILAYDVLEHLVDPYETLSGLRRICRPGGQLHVSVPNARSLVLLRNLIARGTFGYEPTGGICDATHLRWFTRRDMEAALVDAGWSVDAVNYRLGPWGRVADTATLTLMRDFIVGQYYFLASPA